MTCPRRRSRFAAVALLLVLISLPAGLALAQEAVGAVKVATTFTLEYYRDSLTPCHASCS